MLGNVYDFIVREKQEMPMRTCSDIARHVGETFNLIIDWKYVWNILQAERKIWKRNNPGLCGPDW